jgi:phosphoribosylformimino-5-aminoimidazole carboxamide ribotide isomerase
VVRLLRGDFARETTYSNDAVALARAYAAAGAVRLHVVDLDAARGTGDNRELVAEMVAATGIEVQVAGGVRSLGQARAWVEGGAVAVVMGTVAVRRPDVLADVASALPGRVLAALDVRAGRPAVSGWVETETATVAQTLATWAPAALAGVIVTSIDRDGTLAGPDLDLLADVVAATPRPVTYSGGVAGLADVRAVGAAGAAGIILGKSLLEGRLRIADALAAC